MVDTIARQSGELNIETEKGSTFRHTLTWKSGAEGLETPVDLTNCTADMQIRPSQQSDTILHQMTTENGGIILGGINGTIDLYISDVVSTGFDWNTGVYSLEITLANGDVKRLVRGRFTAYDETTR